MDTFDTTTGTKGGSNGISPEVSMTYGGIGPKLALLCLPYVVLALVVMRRHPGFADLKALDRRSMKVLGYLWLVLGTVFWAWSGMYFLKYFKDGKLLTKGPYALCRNPIYSALIVFVVPSLGMIFHSGPILSIPLVLYGGFKFTIHGETDLLRKAFGEEYERYEGSVNEILPFPGRLFGA